MFGIAIFLDRPLHGTADPLVPLLLLRLPLGRPRLRPCRRKGLLKTHAILECINVHDIYIRISLREGLRMKGSPCLSNAMCLVAAPIAERLWDVVLVSYIEERVDPEVFTENVGSSDNGQEINIILKDFQNVSIYLQI